MNYFEEEKKQQSKEGKHNSAKFQRWALFESGRGYALDTTWHKKQKFLFLFLLCLNLDRDLCWTQFVLYFVSFSLSLQFVFRICYWVLFEPDREYICKTFKLDFLMQSCFVFVFGFCLNLLGDLRWTGLGRKSKFEGIARWLSCTVGAHNRTCPTQKYEFKLKKIENGPAAKKQ